MSAVRFREGSQGTRHRSSFLRLLLLVSNSRSSAVALWTSLFLLYSELFNIAQKGLLLTITDIEIHARPTISAFSICLVAKLLCESVGKTYFMKMPELKSGCHSIKSHGIKVIKAHKLDWLILLLLIAIDLFLDGVEPFHCFVGEEMMTNLKYPYKHETIPFWAAQVMAVLFPIVIFVMFYICRRDVYDLHQATKGILFSALITTVITDSIKIAVGRPRPSFFWRCFPDGKAVFDAITKDVVCHGDEKIIREGYKSFPSGHTSWSFAGLGFLAWYLSGKTRLFDRRGHIGKLCLVLLPLLLAGFVGVSRIDDYRHHWQDVLTGGLLGMTVSSICYLLVFPFPHEVAGWAPYAYFEMLGEVEGFSRELHYLPIQQAEI